MNADELEEAKLHSRLEQQSTLICMLKQRLDNTLSELENSKKVCVASSEQLDQVQRSLAAEMRQRKNVEERFQMLASNHDEMIKIKDEYKSEVHRLQDLTGGVDHQRDLLKQQWEESLQAMKLKEQELESELQRMAKEKEVGEEEKELTQSNLQHAKKEIQVWKEKYKDAIKETADLREELRIARADNADMRLTLANARVKSQQLQVEMLEQKELVKRSEEGVAGLRSEMKRLKKSYQEREDMLDRDTAIMSLKKKLADSMKEHASLLKEYEAYKIHSAELLTDEKKLNQQLRHLLD